MGRNVRLIVADGIDSVRGRPLSGREAEVLRLVAMGRTNREIGKQLGISARTVEGHRSRAMMKLDVKNLSELTRYAVRVGLIDA
jgi:DNA-binding CsgD family transcriptional regulator